MSASVLAALENQPIGMKHCLIAVAQELYKQGRQFNKSHFGEYYGLVASLYT